MFFNTSFQFGGEDSVQKFGLKLVRLEGGMIEQTFSGSKKINEDNFSKWDKPTFFGTEKSPLSFSLTLAKEGEWTFDERMEVAHWLNREEYTDFRPEDYPIVFKVMNVGQPTFYNNSFEEGYLTMEFRCDGPYAYTNKKEINLNLVGNGIDGFEYDLKNFSNIRKPYFPEIEIEILTGETGFSIENLSNGAKIEMTSLLEGERVYIDCNKEIVVSSEGVNRVPNLSDLEFLSLIYGVNNLLIKGEILFTLRAQYPIIL